MGAAQIDAAQRVVPGKAVRSPHELLLDSEVPLYALVVPEQRPRLAHQEPLRGLQMTQVRWSWWVRVGRQSQDSLAAPQCLPGERLVCVRSRAQYVQAYVGCTSNTRYGTHAHHLRA